MSKHYCTDDENDQVASACGRLFSQPAAVKFLTHDATAVDCINCIKWMKSRGVLPGDRERLTRFALLLNNEDKHALRVMAEEASVTDAELLRQLVRRAARDRAEVVRQEEETQG